MYGPSHGEGKDDDNHSDSKPEQNGDYDEMFAPSAMDGEHSLQVHRKNCIIGGLTESDDHINLSGRK